MKKFHQIVRTVKKFTSDNKPTILTGVGIAGTAVTGVLAAKAGYSAGYKQSLADQVTTPGYWDDKTRKDRITHVAKETWKLYLPSAVTGVGTIASIAAANKISTNRAAAMAAAYTITDKAFTEYKAKVVETIGEKKETVIRDKIAQEKVDRNSDGAGTLIIGDGQVLCYDVYSDRWFDSTMEDLKKAQNDTNYEILHNMYVSLSEFYSRIGLSPTPYSDEVGWTSDEMLELHFTTCMHPKRKVPAISFTFHAQPIRKFWRANP